MTQNETSISRSSLIAVLLCLSIAACGQKRDLGSQIDIGVSGEGVIIPGEFQSCEDKKNRSTDYSVAPNALVFNNFALRYTGVGKALFLTSLKINVRGSGISGGETSFLISSGELEALVGRSGATITIPDGSTEVIINSNIPSGRSSTYPACSLAVGPVSVVDEDSTFSAAVDFKITGTASNTLTGEIERVEERIQGSAFF